MSDLSLTILPETTDDAVAIERLHERTFGPGRLAKSAYRLREGHDHSLDLSFTARIGTLLVGSVRLSTIRVGDTAALLLGPLTVEPPFRQHGIGKALIERALAEAKARGHRLVILVGDEPYYGKLGFKRFRKGRRSCRARSTRRGFWCASLRRARSAAFRARSRRIGRRLDPQYCPFIPMICLDIAVRNVFDANSAGE